MIDARDLKVLLAGGAMLWLAVATRAWHYLPLPANWRRDPVGVRHLTGFLVAAGAGAACYYWGLARLNHGQRIPIAAALGLVVAALAVFRFIDKFLRHVLQRL